jgi:hypothetical protein
MAGGSTRVSVDAKRSITVAIVEPQGKPNSVVLAYAPGAGSNIYDPFGRFLSERLAEQGFTCIRMQFPYMEEKRRAPDRTPVLEATWRAVMDEASRLGRKLVVGGRSMGGRIASQVVAQGGRVDGLVLYAYPLHSPAKPDVWRDAHLAGIRVPTLFCSGTRDAFASPGELEQIASKMQGAKVHQLDGADHGFAVPAASGRKRQEVWDEAVHATLDWLKKVRI